MYLEVKVNQLEDQLSENNKQLGLVKAKLVALEAEMAKTRYFDREIYYIKDLAELLNCSLDHCRKKYIKTAKVKAHLVNNQYEIDAAEYLRVEKLVRQRGRHYL